MAHLLQILRKTLVGFLSVAVFFAAFFAAGDILIAALGAIAVAVAQLALGWNGGRAARLPIWASLAIILTLTGATLAGDDAASAIVPVSMDAPAADCACRPQPTVKARALPGPHGEAQPALPVADTARGV
jgi:hypothetical protein